MTSATGLLHFLPLRVCAFPWAFHLFKLKSLGLVLCTVILGIYCGCDRPQGPPWARTVRRDKQAPLNYTIGVDTLTILGI